jgi:hypothetical protein
MRIAVSVLALLGCSVALAQGPTIGADNAQSFIGKDATVCGKVESARYNENSEGQPTFMHMGGKFPAHKFAVRINGEHRAQFSPPPEENIGKMVCVSGRVGRAPGNRAEMLITSPGDMTVM